MKYVVSLILGLVTGAALFAAGLLYNPFVAERGLSPLTVTDAEVIALSFPIVPVETIAYTNNGESLHAPHPEKVLQLWEPPIRKTTAMATVMRDARSQVAGIGVKFTSYSESTRLLNGEVVVDSAWYVYLPEQGSLFIEQTENLFPFIREVAVPAWRSSANNWRGTWFGDLTSGPGALGTAAVSGGSGRVDGLTMEAVESMSVQAFSSDAGLVAAEGRLLIALPQPADVGFDDDGTETP